MISEAIDRILGLAGPKTVSVNGRDYMEEKLSPVLPPMVAQLNLNTLQGLCDYIKADKDGQGHEEMILHVVEPRIVRLLDTVESDYLTRDCYAQANAPADTGLTAGQLDLEPFIIAMRTKFADTPERADLLALVGNVTAERVNSVSDDGISQTVAKRAGVTTLAKEKVKNPWTLRPFRTFREVEQPASAYILRLHYQGEEPPKVSLTEVADEAWKLEAIANVRAWLCVELGADLVAKLTILA